jgi:hypothetical protein
MDWRSSLLFRHQSRAGLGQGSAYVVWRFQNRRVLILASCSPCGIPLTGGAGTAGRANPRLVQGVPAGRMVGWPTSMGRWRTRPSRGSPRL